MDTNAESLVRNHVSSCGTSLFLDMVYVFGYLFLIYSFMSHRTYWFFDLGLPFWLTYGVCRSPGTWCFMFHPYKAFKFSTWPLSIVNCSTGVLDCKYSSIVCMHINIKLDWSASMVPFRLHVHVYVEGDIWLAGWRNASSAFQIVRSIAGPATPFALTILFAWFLYRSIPSNCRLLTTSETVSKLPTHCRPNDLARE